MLITLLYYFFGLLIALAAVVILFTSQPFLAAIYLIGIVICLSALYFLQGAPLVAIMQVILHAGGVLILLVCSLLFGHPQVCTAKKRVHPYGKIVALGMLFLCISIIGWKLYTTPSSWISAHVHPTTSSVNALSYQLVGSYGLVLELVGILLLVTLVGTLYIVLQDKR